MASKAKIPKGGWQRSHWFENGEAEGPVVDGFCQSHGSFWCPCANPGLYDPKQRKSSVTPSPGAWTVTREGWAARAVPEAAIQRAKAERAERDATGIPPLWAGGLRWAGHLGEDAFEKWLIEMGVEYERHGGINKLPDFVVKGRGVDVKTRSSNTPFRPGYVVNIPEAHVPDLHDELAFVVYETDPKRVLIVGGIHAEAFLASAEVVAKGEAINPGRLADGACRSIEANRLYTPGDWLANL